MRRLPDGKEFGNISRAALVYVSARAMTSMRSANTTSNSMSSACTVHTHTHTEFFIISLFYFEFKKSIAFFEFLHLHSSKMPCKCGPSHQCARELSVSSTPDLMKRVCD